MSSELVPQKQETQSLSPQEIQAERAEKIAALMTSGDLAKMTKVEKDKFLVELAKLHNLVPWPPPFQIIKTKDGRELLYATKSCADQIRKIHGISLEITYQGPLKLGATEDPNVYVVQCKATDREGRTDEELGSVWIKGLVGEDLANATMKAITKAKRRVTYAITGLSVLDETEIGFASQTQNQYNGPRQITPSGTPPMPRVGTVTVEVVDGLPPVEAPK